MEDRKKSIGKNNYCSNCNNTGHYYKNCLEPITSIGIIHFSISNILGDFCDTVIENLKKNTGEINIKGIRCENIIRDTSLSNLFRDALTVTLIRRKYSLGFMEFIRGKYKIENIDGLIYLFKQMMKEEIDLIKNTEDFDDIWFKVWVDKNSSTAYSNEYKMAKDKFNKLRNINDEELLNLDFYVNNVKPEWKTPEWGFPKGRRNINETDLDCATREFIEETGIPLSEITILDNIPPISETFVGTNGISYRHIYYLAVSKNDIDIKLDTNNHDQNIEIGDIGSFTYNRSLKIIRSYHTARKKILNECYMYCIDNMIKWYNEKNPVVE